MAISYVGGQVGGRAGANSTTTVTYALTGGSNSTPQAGDFVVVTMVVGSAGRNPAQAVTAPGTWSNLGQLNPNTQTYDTSMDVSYKRMGTTPDTNLTAPVTGNAQDAQSWTIQVFRGVDSTNPLDVAAVAASAVGTGRPDPGSITPTTSGAWVVICGGGAATTGAAYTAPANYTTGFLTNTIADTNDSMIGSGYRSWTSGAENPAQYTGGTTNAVDSWAAYTIALRPAANNYPLTAQGGSYSVTGGTASLLRSKKLVASGGSYSLTGGSATLSKFDPSLPRVLGTAQLTLGTSLTPGAQSITVPVGTQLVVAFVGATNGSAQPLALALTSNFANTFTVIDSLGPDGCSIGYATVTSTGSKTITPSWTNGTILEGPTFHLAFIDNIDTGNFLLEALAYATNDPAALPSISINTNGNCILLAQEEQDGASGVPTTMSGYTSLQTQSNNGSAANLQQKNTVSGHPTTVTGTGGAYGTLAAISVRKVSSVTNYTLTCQGGAYSATGQSATLKRSKLIVSSGGSYALTGQSAVLRKGLNLAASGGSYSVTGQTANLLRSKRIVSSGGAYAYTGQQAILSRSKYIIAQGGTYSLTGGSAVLTWTPSSVNYTLTALGGSYSLTGQNAVLSRNRVLTSQGGSYTLAGQSATLLRSKKIVASGGSYTYTGQNAILLKSKKLISQGGSYALTGQNATLLRSKYVSASGGTYNLVGSQAILTWTPLAANYLLIAQGGAYTLSGQNALLLKSKIVVAQGGSYVYTGQQATVLRSKKLISSGGSYSVVGSSSVITWTPAAVNYLLIAQGGAYSLNGSSVTLLKSKVLSSNGGSYSVSGGSAIITTSGGSTGQAGTSRLVRSGLPQKQSDLKLPRELVEKLQAESIEADLKKRAPEPEPVVVPKKVKVKPVEADEDQDEEFKPPFNLKPIYEYLRASNEEKRISGIIRGLTLKTDLQIRDNVVKYQRTLSEDQAQKDLEDDQDVEFLLMNHI